MDSKVIIILGSSRKNGNTKKLVSDIYNSSAYQLIDLLDYTIYPFNYEALYPADDQFGYIVDQVLNCNTLVFATPVYWYAMSGLLKSFFDRLTDIVTVNKADGRKLKGKSVRLAVTGTDSELPAGFEVPFESTAKYLDMVFDGCVYRVTND